MHIDIDILVYAVIAIVLLGRLWFVLGTRNDEDPQRPNPFIPPPQIQAVNDVPAAQVSRMLPTTPPPGSVAGGLAQVVAIIPAFDEKQFLQEARASFSSIVEAYASGNLSAVTPLLSPALLSQFQQAANARAANGQKAQTRVAQITEAEPTAARAEGTQAFITVKFTSDQENILRDARDAIIGGILGKTETVTDVWVFAKDTQAVSGKWVVVETRG